METSVKQRLTQFLKYLGISQRQFERSVGLGNGYITNMSKGLGVEKTSTIKEVYPQLNIGWLLSGEGEMLRSSDTPDTAPTEPTSLDKLLDIMEQDHALILEQLQRKDETIDRLLSIMEADRNIERKKETA